MVSTSSPEVGSVNLLDAITKDRELPAGYDQWAIRTVRPGLTSQHGYRYPFPGKVAKASGPFVASNNDECPMTVGDGICAATTWRGMASGGVPARTLLLVAYRERDVLGGSRAGKLRLKQFKVIELIDGELLLQTIGSYADLSDADLSYANLSRANLSRANLSRANLSRANLSDANLSRANLSGADLPYANLSGANLSRANLSGADLPYANLYGANLPYANLSDANLSGANLSYANLSYANLPYANLSDANLSGARNVQLPAGWKLTPSGIAVRA